jgi:hypothetical protein
MAFGSPPGPPDGTDGLLTAPRRHFRLWGTAAQRAQAEAFYRPVGAVRFIGNGEALDARASVDG